jgi:hypothetical protein
MAQLRFQDVVTYGKSTPVDLKYASSHCLVSSLSSQFPFFLPKPQLQALVKTAGGVAGLTVPDFSLEFPDFANQWRLLSSTPPRRWQFQGGPLSLECLIKIFVDDRARGRPEVLDPIMEHEFLHVADEIEILQTDLPARLKQDSIVQRYLIDQNPVDDAMFQNWFKTDKFQDYVQPTWAEEHNRRAHRRDSGMAYARYINLVSGRM